MNITNIRKILGKILVLLAIFTFIPAIVAIVYHESWLNIVSFAAVSLFILLIGFLLQIKTQKAGKIAIRESLFTVAISWILMSLVGALPFVISGAIPNYFDALFEITSGFTTTGATILEGTEFDVLGESYRSMLFWRSFSHWIGGMGIIVFVLMIIPESKQGSSMHILRAESPGPTVGKLVSKMASSSRILYLIYIGLTLLEFGILLLIKDPNIGIFEAMIYAFGTAGTGGFALTASSFACYSVATQYVVAAFMIVFGINFTFYYYLIIFHYKDAFKLEETWWYLLTILFSTLIIFLSLYFNNIYGKDIEETFRHSFFQVASIISTTGFSTTDYATLWPALPLIVIIAISIFGSCAGSTSGGVKQSRVVLLAKNAIYKIRNMASPRKVENIRFNGEVVDKDTISSIYSFFVTYILILGVSSLLITIYNPAMPDIDVTTSLSASLACISNVGPGLGKVGPAGSFKDFSGFSKVILSLEMIAGRLELFPILSIFSKGLWRKAK